MNSPRFDLPNDQEINSSKLKLSDRDDDDKNRVDVRVEDTNKERSIVHEIAATKDNDKDENKKFKHIVVDMVRKKKRPSPMGLAVNGRDDKEKKFKDDKTSYRDAGAIKVQTTHVMSSKKDDHIKEEQTGGKSSSGENSDKVEGEAEAMMGETSIHSYYTDNIAAACAATNDELTSPAPVDGISKCEGAENDFENRRRQKPRKTSSSSSSAPNRTKLQKKQCEQEIQSVPENTVALLIAELQRQNTSLVQENAALRQQVRQLSTMLEAASLASSPSRTDVTGLLGQLAAPYSRFILQPQLSAFSHPTSSHIGGGIGSGVPLASILGLGENYPQIDEQQRITALLASLGATTDLNALVSPPSVLSRAPDAGQTSSLLQQLILGTSSSSAGGNQNLHSSVAVSSTSTPSDLQRYLAEARANTRLGSSINTSNSSSRDVGGIATEPGENAMKTKFASSGPKRT